MRRVYFNSFGIWVMLGLWGLYAVSIVLGQGQEVIIPANIKEIKDVPEKYVDKKVALQGTLRFIDSVTGHDWVLEDGQGNQIAIYSYANEVLISPPPPSPDFDESRKTAPKPMSYYRDKELSITGRLKINKGDLRNSSRKYYVDVESLNELQEK